MSDNEETEPTAPVFDPTAYPEDTLFHERRQGRDRRQPDAAGEAIEPVHAAARSRTGGDGSTRRPSRSNTPTTKSNS